MGGITLKKKYINPRLIGQGLGIFAASFAAMQATNIAMSSGQKTIAAYAREIVGAGMTVAGSVMMTNPQLRNLGVAVGSVGVSTLASSALNRVMGVATTTEPAKFSTAPATSNGNGLGGIASGIVKPPKTPIFTLPIDPNNPPMLA